eukprot:CAMPEP_0196818816 /NCGR_PEP_ID=MMETSP1362-20130617/67672_1 /TAXON_ID=163516 /ORGANISM="Leptocylindrus danicus, Strain CCMP1856" /LENGTH=43 /DNA_ID= /DNA_START= /DNA_END= /DNA_ORIENTATION=
MKSVACNFQLPSLTTGMFGFPRAKGSLSSPWVRAALCVRADVP